MSKFKRFITHNEAGTAGFWTWFSPKSPMTSDFEMVPSIASLAGGKTVGGGELAFTFPEILEVIRLCTVNEIAVLGVEIFEVRADGYYTKNWSVYDQQMKRSPEQRQEWSTYVGENNAFAEEFIHLNRTGDDHIYVLTTSSWREFCKIQEMKRQ